MKYKQGAFDEKILDSNYSSFDNATTDSLFNRCRSNNIYLNKKKRVPASTKILCFLALAPSEYNTASAPPKMPYLQAAALCKYEIEHWLQQKPSASWFCAPYEYQIKRQLLQKFPISWPPFHSPVYMLPHMFSFKTSN